MRPLDVERFLNFPAARGIDGRLGAAGIYHLEVGGGDSELRVKRGEIGGGVRVVVGVDNGEGAASTNRQSRGDRGRASGNRRGQAVDAGEGRGRFKKVAAWAGRWNTSALARANASACFRAVSGSTGALARKRARRRQRLTQFVEENVGMRAVTDVLGLFRARFRDHDGPRCGKRLRMDGGKREADSAPDNGGKGEFHDACP